MKVKTTRNGEPCIFEFRDLGTKCPAFDEQGNAYEAYTSEITIESKTHFIQIDKLLAERTGKPEQIRLVEDYAFLESIGIDPSEMIFEGDPDFDITPPLPPSAPD